MSPSLRWLCAALVVVGFVAAGLGALGDAHSWWDDKPFLTNLASSLTGALFGIPFALVVLHRLTRSQSERAARSAAISAAFREARTLHARATAVLAVGSTTEDLSVLLAGLDELHSRAITLVNAREISLDRRPTKDDRLDESKAMAACADALHRAIGLWSAALRDPRDTTRAWHSFREQWAVLQSVRERFIELGEPWLELSLTEPIRDALALAEAQPRVGFARIAETDGAQRLLVAGEAARDGRYAPCGNADMKMIRDEAVDAHRYVQALHVVLETTDAIGRGFAGGERTRARRDDVRPAPSSV